MKWQWAALVAAAGLLVGAEDKKPDDKKPDSEASRKDLDKLQGTWTLVSAKADGADLPKELAAKLKLVIDKDKFSIKNDDSEESATVTLDPGQKPPTIDIKPAKEDAVKGIYELKDDELKLCWAKAGKERPKGFESKEGSGEILFVLKREKK
jgi:uncharacterized protein (TIGR03067 family)